MPAKLCSRERLFQYFAFQSGFGIYQAVEIYSKTMFVMSTWFVLLPIGFALFLTVRRLMQGQPVRTLISGGHKKKLRDWMIKFMEAFPIIAIAGVFVPTMVIISTQDSIQREAVVAVDLECHALHVSLSPWRQYFDVNNDYRALWIARSWFAA